MHLFYSPKIALECVLPEEESQHAIRVLRLKSGDKIDVVDGVGNWYKCRITNPHPKYCEFEILESIAEFGKRNHRVHVAIAPTKNIERFEWFVEKCTEMGIDEITPLLCRFSERKVIKPERIEKLIVSAAKQSLKAYFPVLHPMVSFDDFVANNHSPHMFIAHCYEDKKTLFQHVCVKEADNLILIGPEGDFSPEEVQKAIQLGYTPVSLGESRLRTETAGIVACHTAVLLNER